VVFFADTFFAAAAGFFAAGRLLAVTVFVAFFAPEDLVAVFLAAGFLAAVFLAAVFFAGAGFLAAAFFAPPPLLFAAAFFAAVFFAGVLGLSFTAIVDLLSECLPAWGGIVMRLGYAPYILGVK
jgi:hypothetical protein